MKFGHFDDKNREYVITRPDTPWPWINYLGTQDFFGIISNTAGGYCFYQDSKLRRLTRYRYSNMPADSNGRYLYIRDNNEIWTPMWQPMQSELEHYECRHGLGYTKILSEKNGLQVQITFFIPENDPVEVWDVVLKNTTAAAKSIRLWSFIEWCLWDAYDDMTNFQRNFSIGEVEVDQNVIYHKTEYRERRNHYAYFSCSDTVGGFDTDRDQFVGVYQSAANPQVVMQGESRNSVALGWAPIGSHQLDIQLAPGQSQNLHFLLGYAESPKEAKFTSPGVINKSAAQRIIKKYAAGNAVQQAFNTVIDNWRQWLSIYQVESEDVLVDRAVNIWNQYQCMATLNFSRSTSLFESGIGRGMGFRDSNQDVLGYVHFQPERARQRILDIAATQLSDGTCYHQYQPLTKQGNADVGGGFMDDHLWLILSTSAYLKETGDFTILDEQIGFADRTEKSETLFDHLKLSIEFTLKNPGPHGLPLIGHADWNDCLNLNCFSEIPGESFQLAQDSGDGQTAESLMIAGLFCYACDKMAEIYQHLQDESAAINVQRYAREMREKICSAGWDGDWFLRAYDSFGNPLGTAKDDFGKIFIESQGWCVLGGAGLENGFAAKALENVHKYLASKNGIKLHHPPFEDYELRLGEITSYPPGYKENAGIFTHNNTWIQIAETLLGNGDRAMQYYKAILPSTKEEQIETYRLEPYVYSQMTAGPDAIKPGEGKNSWLTGTAAWSFVVISQYILGIHPEFDGLRIAPCIPHDWQKYEVTRKFRNATYKIVIKNPESVCSGVLNITVDGKKMDGEILPIFNDGKVHRVEVIMGRNN